MTNLIKIKLAILGCPEVGKSGKQIKIDSFITRCFFSINEIMTKQLKCRKLINDFSLYSFVAIAVRYLTKKFIGEYSSQNGEKTFFKSINCN